MIVVFFCLFINATWTKELANFDQFATSVANCSALPVITTFNAAYVDVAVLWAKSMINIGAQSCIFLFGVSAIQQAVSPCQLLRKKLKKASFCGDLVPQRNTQSATSSYWMLRTRLLIRIAQRLDRPFAHCDNDAFWVRDISRELLDLCDETKSDFLFSRGLGWPKSHMDKHGFTHCLGFWIISPSERAIRFLKSIPQSSKDDQVAINTQLQKWDVSYTKYQDNHWLGEASGDLRLLNVGFDVVDRRCPSFAPILHCLSTKRANDKLRTAKKFL